MFKKINIVLLLLFSGFILIGLIFSPSINAQLPTIPAVGTNWAALPPYNTLWPLWTPALSPVNPATGLPTPLVTSITPNTVLPVQPGLTWYFALGHPWLLYNTPIGLAYYDPWTGIDLWPPEILMNQINGLPIVITLPPTYANFPVTPSWWLFSEVPAANWEFLISYPNFTGVLPSTTAVVTPTLNSLLTATNLLL